ncbi:class-II fumarase/aspartase family protein [Solirubrobacter soli]|uniref:class-II fumarase/aspartase family protein n=1 Tax=Solirubrobacter soli TaxID=363832 RepID=UPI000413FF75|nr:adenylosuccinate lyase family protein [Solirubrobacter soli]
MSQGIDLADSVIYGHLWATDEARALLGDEGRTRAWVRIIAALAAAQGELGLIPPGAAAELEGLDATGLDLAAVGEATRASGHSTLGLIRVLREDLGPEAAEWLYYGATVQDVTDTWFGLVMQRMLAIARRDLEATARALSEHAERHRDTVMLGRTHGQPGLPITFGFKAAVWAAEVHRHLERIGQAEPRLAVGQLAGAVGTLSAYGDAGLELQRRLMDRLGLGVPDASWLVARDRVAEFVTLLALITGTLAKVGNEVYNLQRPELGEVSEAPTAGVVGSITMPQKRNPERSEHLWTLARLVRGHAGLALEGLVGEHERDGAAWKTEWAVLPQAAAAASVSLALGRELVEGLRVDATRMRENLDAQRGYVLAEPAMLALAARIGKHHAHELVHRAALAGQEAGMTLQEALAADAEIAAALSRDELAALLRPEAALGAAGEMVDEVVARGRTR